MPTVLRVGGFVFSFYANEHEPSHVHVRCGGQTCRVELATLLVKNIDMDARNRAKALRIIVENADVLEQAWQDFQQRKAGAK
jgi:hypothetical protein